MSLIPWHISEDEERCSPGKPFAVVKDGDGSTAGCHATEQGAKDQLAALYASERRAAAMESRDAKPRLVERGGRVLSVNEVREVESDTAPVHDRYLSFKAMLETRTDKRDDKDFLVVEGVASTFDQSYEMFDEFGQYQERVSAGAADETLSNKPDVVFLVNHKGLAMARTAGPWNDGAGTLDLWAERDGLHSRAFLNPKRSEVMDLALAMQDKIVTEMLFAFMIDRGEWNEDFTEYAIQRFDINRGDVSAVNYGANPHTYIAARQQELLEELRQAGGPVARAAWHVLSQRTDLSIEAATEEYRAAVEVDELNGLHRGMSTTQLEAEITALIER